MTESETLLIVDDDEGVRLLLDATLKQLQVHRSVHRDIASARRYVQEGGRVDVALIDRNLPDGLGEGLIGWLRDQVPTCEALLMTADMSLDSAIIAMQAGACDYVRKPFDDMAQVKLRVFDALEKVKLKREQALLLEKLKHDAMHDLLTGLPNRSTFLDRLRYTLDEIIRNPDRLFAVLFIDLDRFKQVNDNLGHAEGDKLLAEIGRRLRGCVREVDLVARLGGDEFTILLRELEQPTDAARVAERIHQALSQPFEISGREIRTACSIGAALSNDHKESLAAGSAKLAEIMLREADMAMYRAKKTGKNSTHFFDAEVQARAQRAWDVESSLLPALDAGEVTVAYQPIVELPSRRIIGFEALVRWKSEKLGQVAPLELIAVAEECDMIDHVFDHVFDLSIAQLKRWRKLSPNLSLSMNLSNRQLRHLGLVDKIAAKLAAAQIPPHALELEITESALMEDPKRARTILAKLREVGMRLAIDDFGTGYSSLSYLSQLPVTTLKIDRSFVCEMHEKSAANIVGFMVDLARNLEMLVIAEGVERTVELDALVERGCSHAQGYLFSKPLPADAMTSFLETQQLP